MKKVLILLALCPAMSFAASKHSKKYKKRAVASSIGENDLSTEFVNLRNKIIGGVNERGVEITEVKTASDLDELIDAVDKNYSKYKEDSAKLLTAQLAFLKVYRGVLYRARPLAEDYKLVKSALINGLRFSGQATQIYMPTPQWKAGYNYLIEPFAFKSNERKIKDDASFKVYLTTNVIPALEKLRSRIEGINFNNVIWDNKIFYRDAKFVDDKDRFVRLSNVEKNALLATVHSSISAGHGLEAYKLRGLFKTMEKISKSYGFNAVFNPVNSLAEKRTRIIKRNLSLTLNNKAALRKSYKALIRSVEYAQEALDGAERKNGDSNSWNLLNFAAINAFSRTNNNLMQGASNIVLPKGNREIASAVVSGEIVKVNLKDLFVNNPPKDLKAFLPTGYEGGESSFTKTINGERKVYRNYLKGNPNAWKVSEFKKYFPNVRTNEDVKKTVRIISQSYGVAGLGGPLSLVMF